MLLCTKLVRLSQMVFVFILFVIVFFFIKLFTNYNCNNLSSDSLLPLSTVITYKNAFTSIQMSQIIKLLKILIQETIVSILFTGKTTISKITYVFTQLSHII